MKTMLTSDRRARVEALFEAVQADRAALNRLPLPPWSPEAQRREEPLAAIRERATLADRMRAWRRLFAPAPLIWFRRASSVAVLALTIHVLASAPPLSPTQAVAVLHHDHLVSDVTGIEFGPWVGPRWVVIGRGPTATPWAFPPMPPTLRLDGTPRWLPPTVYGPSVVFPVFSPLLTRSHRPAHRSRH